MDMSVARLRPLRPLLAVTLLATHCVWPAPARATDLSTVLELAEQSDPEYRAAQANALAVAEGIPQARAALWKPVLAFTTGGARVQDDIETESAFGAGGTVDYDRTDYRLAVTQPVYHYDRIVLLKQADKALQQAQYQLDAAQQSLIIRVAERYFVVLAAEDNLEFARAEQEALQGQLEEAKQRFEVGLLAITDIQEAQAGHDRAHAQVISAENLLDNAHEALRETTGAYHEVLSPLGVNLPLAKPDPENIETWTETALAQNLELAAAQVAAEIAEQQIRLEYAGHFPTIDIEGGHGFNSQGGRFGQTDIESSDIGVRLNIPLYQGGAVSSRTRAATHQHEAALERLEAARRAVFRESREAYLGILSQISAVEALKQSVVSSMSSVDSTRAGFEVGTRTSVDVVTAEQGLSEARRDYARARYDYVLVGLRLRRAAGTLGPEDIAVANSWLQQGEGESNQLPDQDSQQP